MRYFTRFEQLLWGISVLGILLSFWISGEFHALYCITTLIGVTALIFLAKGNVVGQILTVVFSLFYGFVSFRFQYYGEMVTYLGLTAPMAVLATIQWFKNPFQKGKNEVEIASLTQLKLRVMVVLTVLVTVVFYFILGYFHTANLPISTLSVASSFAAVYLTYCRSRWYAVAYAVNDLVLIALWTLATLQDPAYLTMVICFLLFFVNDLYAYYNWGRIEKAQQES